MDLGNLHPEDNQPWWKQLWLVIVITVASSAVMVSVFLLPLYLWIRIALLIAILGILGVSIVDENRRLQVILLTTCSILVIYTVIGVILGKIDISW